ncbi:B3 domain-containing protein [Trema orientale]|uniref:B3 domain-containing protein n=1 Tax=Trema orientale TaxID=63057 RepID=A0A2P5FIG5_TREOI|nr:B3 domain-containing protein [Trema orientale]
MDNPSCHEKFMRRWKRWNALVQVCSERHAEDCGPPGVSSSGDYLFGRERKSVQRGGTSEKKNNSSFTVEGTPRRLGGFWAVTKEHAIVVGDDESWEVESESEREREREREGKSLYFSSSSSNSAGCLHSPPDMLEPPLTKTAGRLKDNVVKRRRTVVDDDDDWEGERERKRETETTKKHSSSSSSTLPRRKRPTNMNTTSSGCSSEDSPPPDMPRAMSDFVKGRLMSGSQEVFIIKKMLMQSDLQSGQNRLSMPLRSIKSNNFLSDDEISTLTRRLDDGHYQGMPVHCYFHPYSAEEGSDMVLKKWEYHNGSTSYVLTKNWYKVASRKGFNVGDFVGIWFFRDTNGEPCFALDNFRQNISNAQKSDDHTTNTGNACCSPQSEVTME